MVPVFNFSVVYMHMYEISPVQLHSRQIWPPYDLLFKRKLNKVHQSAKNTKSFVHWKKKSPKTRES